MTSAAAAEGLLSIGEVLQQLRPDFPDITISKIRFLESEGLVEPARTASGYRKFTRADAERLHYVLRMQSQHYLPLKVIRDHLDAMDRGMRPPPLAADELAPRALVATADGPSAQELAADSQELRLSRSELLTESALDEEMLRELESHGLVSTIPGTSYYGPSALQISRIAALLASYGYGPRHLRPFKLAADRELALVEQVVKPMARGRQVDARERAEDAARAIASLAVQLHVALVKAGLPAVVGR